MLETFVDSFPRHASAGVALAMVGQIHQANEVWEEVKRYWRKIPASQSDQGLELRRILRDYESEESREDKSKAILQATKVNSKENKKV